MIKRLIHPAKVKYLKGIKFSLFVQSSDSLGSALYKFFLWLGPQGYRVVGTIVEFNLAQKKQICEKFNINNLTDIATWADKVRRNRKQRTPYHYTIVKEDEWVYLMPQDCQKGNCVIEKK